jgi:hypothetical protein
MATLPAGGRRITPMPGGVLPRAAVRRLPAEAFTDVVGRAAAAIALAAVIVGGLILAERRLAGGFGSSDPGLAWMTLGVGAVLLSVARITSRGRGDMVAAVAARLALVVGVAAIAAPAAGGGWGAVLPVAAAVGIGCLPLPGRSVADRPSRRLPARPARPRDLPRPRATVGNAATRPRPVDPPAGRLHQRVERYEAADGADCVSGHVRLTIPAGGKTTHAHVGFCPAFASIPTVQVTTDYDGVEAVVAAAEVVPWGVRVECRLSEPAEEPLEIPVDLIAKAPRA